MFVCTYSNVHQKLWDDFVINESKNGSIFSEQKFLSYHKNKFSDRSILIYNEDKLVGVFPAAEEQRSGVKGIVSHPGSSSGGLIYLYDAKTNLVLEILDKLIEYYKQLNYFFLEINLNEPIFDLLPADELRYLLWHRGFIIRTKEISSCVNLKNHAEWKLFGRKKNQTDINSIIRKGYGVQITKQLNEVYPLIESNLKERYNKRPTHSFSELNDLLNLYDERIHLWKMTLANKIVATVVIFIANKVTVHDFYIAQNPDFEKINVFPMLFYTLFNYYSENNYHWFNFGISSRGSLIKWGILEFKERLGGRASIRESMVLNNLQSYDPYEK